MLQINYINKNVDINLSENISPLILILYFYFRNLSQARFISIRH